MVGIHRAVRQWNSGITALLKSASWLGLFLYLVMTVTVSASEDTPLDQEIAEIRSEVASLSQTLFELEEAILHPADTQVSVFLNLKTREGLELNSVELYMDDSPVSSHLYTERERESLRQGGVQRLYIGNLPHGDHELKAILTARSANDRFIRREVFHDFRKRPGESRIQITLDAAAPNYEPDISFQEWK